MSLCTMASTQFAGIGCPLVKHQLSRHSIFNSHSCYSNTRHVMVTLLKKLENWILNVLNWEKYSSFHVMWMAEAYQVI